MLDCLRMRGLIRNSFLFCRLGFWFKGISNINYLLSKLLCKIEKNFVIFYFFCIEKLEDSN